MYIINVCVKTPKPVVKHEKATSYNVIIVTMKNPRGEKLRNKHYLTLTLPH
jgi:hypothetical protein